MCVRAIGISYMGIGKHQYVTCCIPKGKSSAIFNFGQAACSIMQTIILTFVNTTPALFPLYGQYTQK